VKFRPNHDEYSPILTVLCTEDEIQLYSDELEFEVLLKFETDVMSLSVGVDEYLETK
jgi:hypothetical protein